MIEMMLLDNNPDDCNNVGPACMGCPLYDQCDHHFEEDEA